MHSNLDHSQIEQALQQVRKALEGETSDHTRSALQASQRILETLAGSPQSVHPSKYDGCIDYTFDDEQYEPFGRAVDVRIYYRWSDYNPADDPRPVWGATVVDLEVVGVRYFDETGNEVDGAKHAADVAWHLLDKFYQQVTEACTEDGYHRGVGNAPPTFASTGARGIARPQEHSVSALSNFGSRMAPSMATRTTPLDRRQLG